ncbi:ABC transporter ATP-binding protein [Candidatus Falkowbacteria bacterium]|jgi:ABC-type multidrug transport system fused ATPase/permease subunit|nr:ABC transporter ATP-binding protein [Candidatus Falkowbacteria bacterium]MBT5503730.1 ABC transporter ATP-binding protein [Candidatus Falkowbacteria bacterium]MBT6573791.1 ABC transporter ATP-binding protein [Candidatus Falkowbacteria bacterium]MBT7348119.1 ABC transporter ATP-binding protein [Candidatus Falkowbacteria bacterium]MBT7500705.1 ABC transporter ATP-binding protein [Candidatus Falkowbacteria bacterium]
MSDWEMKLEKKDRNIQFLLRSLRTLWELLGDQKKAIGKAVFVLFFIEILSVSFPFLLKLIFDQLPEIIIQKQVSTYLVVLIGCLLVVKVVALVLKHFVAEISFLRGLIKLENGWPVVVQEKLLSLSIGFHETENTGKKISKIEKGCDKLVQIVIDMYWGILPQVFFLLINVTVAIIIDWKLGLLFMLPFIPAMYIHYRMFNRFEDDWEAWEKKKEESGGLLCQSIINVSTVQNFGQEKRELQQNLKIREFMQDLDINICEKMQLYFFGSGLILHLFYFITIALGFTFVFMGISSIGTIVYLIATGNITIFCIGDIMHTYTRVMRKSISVSRMKELMDTEIDIETCPEAIVPNSYAGEFEFDEVSFTYSGKDRPVLKDFSMMIHPHQMVALVGKSGEGKTTMIRLISRMYDIDEGSIKLDGRDIRDLDLEYLRKIFAIVQQDVDIFDTTLLENIRYPDAEASEEQVIEALKASHLYEALQNLDRFPDGIKTQVGERGIRLSGGERQRVGIARAYIALLNGARVLILDEATSNLDSEAEKAIQKMIGKVREKLNISIIAIAHRLSTIQKADMIYVINNGNVAESGDHSRLVQENGLYAHLVELQKLGDLRE